MNKINRNNYEEFFLDFIDGTISPEDKQMLVLFLEANPDLKQEIYLFENIKFEPVSNYEGKELLKRERILNDKNQNNFNYLCIAQMEGDLSEKESKEFLEFLKQNKSKEKEYNIFLLTKLQLTTIFFLIIKSS